MMYQPVSDTRIAHAKALIDDARTIAADILDETTCPPLDDVRQYLNWALQAFDRADDHLSVRAE